MGKRKPPVSPKPEEDWTNDSDDERIGQDDDCKLLSREQREVANSVPIISGTGGKKEMVSYGRGGGGAKKQTARRSDFGLDAPVSAQRPTMKDMLEPSLFAVLKGHGGGAGDSKSSTTTAVLPGLGKTFNSRHVDPSTFKRVTNPNPMPPLTLSKYIIASATRFSCERMR